MSIDSVQSRMAAAWDAGDAAAYAALFTSDATYVVFDGTVLQGAKAIEDVHRFLFEGPLRGSRMAAAQTAGADPVPPEVRFLRPDVALMLVRGEIQPDGESGAAPDRASVVSLVLVDTPDGWQIAAFQNTRVQERRR
jgi:uncharacterized protein (TIGR02246 family)